MRSLTTLTAIAALPTARRRVLLMDSSSNNVTNEVTAPAAAITFRLNTARQRRGTGEFCR